jgi:hypothetical protein
MHEKIALRKAIRKVMITILNTFVYNMCRKKPMKTPSNTNAQDIHAMNNINDTAITNIKKLRTTSPGG